MKLRLPSSTHNWISLSGAVLAIVSFSMIVFLFFVGFFLHQQNTYLGLIIYIILPVFLIIGLLLIPIGMFWKKKKSGEFISEEDKFNWPSIDLNDKKHRNAFMIFTIGSSIFLFASAIGSYEAFNFTESVTFCGTLCHTVMKPEYTAYQHSPHARVACVECHVGSGADWYVRSKLAGLHQVYAVITNDFDRPIPTPIRNLRPARETCEECHWPEKFYSRTLITEKHFIPDSANTEWDIQLIMKIGPSHRASSFTEGIHWHINPDVKIEYISTDSRRQVIPWIKYTNLKTGKAKIFEDSENPITKEQKDSLQSRTMDCMDCHNRPSHNYKPPTFFVNNAIENNKIPKELPFIKSVAMNACDNNLSTTDSAMAFISKTISDYYKEELPEVYSSKKNLIDKAITGLQEEYKLNIFPEMKVRWDAYPNNIGHIEFMGCFRCHDGNHETEDGNVIPNDCSTCHTIIAQGNPGNMEYDSEEKPLEFRHPDPDDDSNEECKDAMCVECHTGLTP